MLMLRILAGAYRGRWIKGAPRGSTTRPILARIKKSLFDILQPHIRGCTFLDLYAGTGSVGIEALSRGAEWVTFVDNDKKCVWCIEENLKKLQEEKAEILKLDVLKEFHNRKREYDIIFIGPPYKGADKQMLALTGETLKMIQRERFLASPGLIVAQHHVKEVVPPIPGLNLARQEKYGDSTLSFFKHITDRV